jgi:uncharacterized membrane protein (DUF485 family)
MMNMNPKTQRLAYIAGVAVLAGQELPMVGEFLKPFISHEIGAGVTVATIIALGVLFGTWLLYERKLG